MRPLIQVNVPFVGKYALLISAVLRKQKLFVKRPN